MDRDRLQSRLVPTYCYQCVAGPDLMTVKVENDVATEVAPNFDAAAVHPAVGKVCVKAFGLVQKKYNPHRILTPMKRTNPRKGRDQDPGFEPISWDQALDLVGAKLREAQAKGLRDHSGFPRLAASFGGGGTPTAYMGTLPAFLSAWGPVDFSFGSGQGVKCTHSEHLYGEFWHRAFTVSPDTPNTEYIISFGHNVEATGGVCGVWRHANARARGAKRVQIEPHLSVTGACSAEWVPVRPKTDAAFLFAMLHVLVHENMERLDIPFLKHRTSAPYLVAPGGFYLRHSESRKPLIWDLKSGAAVPFDSKGSNPALGGSFVAYGVEVGADDESWSHEGVEVQPAFSHLIEHVKDYTPAWAATICDVPETSIRRIAEEFLDHAHVGETIEVDGRELPYRPVAVVLGKTVNNGWGGFDCCWARTVLACLVGALEVPGGTLGTAVRLNRPAGRRQLSVKPGEDGLMDYPMSPTDKENWVSEPQARSAYGTLVPLTSDSAWSGALGPTQIAWMQQQRGFDKLPKPTPPDVWLVYRTNPAISYWDTETVAKSIADFPFTVCFAYTLDETNHFADILLPDCTDLEGLQLIRIGGTKYVEYFWDHRGFALRQPVAEPPGEARDFTWVATELARRSGLLSAYNAAINHGHHGVPLTGENYDFALDPERDHSVEEIWDATCRAASAELTDGAENQGLSYFKEHGWRTRPMPRLDWYLYPALEDHGLRFEIPYQERLYRIGRQLANRLHEQGIEWWDDQLAEYEVMPVWKDYPGLWERALEKNFDVKIADFPFWLLTSHSMQMAWGGNAGIQLMREVADNVTGHGGLIMNAARAAEIGLAEGDLVEVRSPLAATRGRVVLRQGIRPDTIHMIGQFSHWATPLAKDLETSSMNALVPMIMDLVDSTGSGADLVKVSVVKIGGGL